MNPDLHDLHRLADVLDFIVDPKAGVIQFIREMPRLPCSPDFAQFVAYAGDTGAYIGHHNFRSGGGASPHRGRAVAKAAGECLERYAAALFEIDEFPATSFEAASRPCADPDRFSLYSAAQYEAEDFPFVAFTRQTSVRWCPALHVPSGHTIDVPAAAVFVPWQYDVGAGDNPIMQPISTGLACHCSWEEAAVSAICEVVERDAFTIVWQAMMAPPRIRRDSIDDANDDLLARFERKGFRVTLFDITLDHGIPTILAVALHDAPLQPPMIFAGASSPSPAEAVRKALEETAHTGRWIEGKMRDGSRVSPDPDFANIVSQNDHLQLYCDPRNVRAAECLFASDVEKSLSDIAPIRAEAAGDLVHALVQRIGAVGEDVYLVDLTPADLSALGLRVARAVVPGFHRLAAGHRIRCLGGHRLWSVPQKLGHGGIRPKTGDNPWPHPYP